ncbi:hypothetical protein TPL01_22540 [Sulfuriferula plumbiphila]|uniref:Uncharacterized protein n=1 Tax=Sulfuriferula plumbiphila TaxID=171865 RepID=A0A512L9F2_9PROT|nr:hypothetical protein TPL01_22540 [Sulfuriferula plumbiphila]
MGKGGVGQLTVFSFGHGKMRYVNYEQAFPPTLKGSHASPHLILLRGLFVAADAVSVRH